MKISVTGSRNLAVPHHTEDKNWWYLHGEKLEESFVSLCQVNLNLDAKINPEKANDKTVPDLVVEGKLADLKTQNTPFFTSQRYGLDPRFTVTFNRKDYERYKQQYPDIQIYFWIDWKQTESKWGVVDYYGGFFRLAFRDVAKIIESGAPEHHYIHRKFPGDRNAKSSFLLDIRKFDAIFIADQRHS